MAELPKVPLQEISNEQFAEAHVRLEHKRALIKEYDDKMMRFVADLDEQYQPLFAAIDADIQEILGRGTPPSERPQES